MFVIVGIGFIISMVVIAKRTRRSRKTTVRLAITTMDIMKPIPTMTNMTSPTEACGGYRQGNRRPGERAVDGRDRLGAPGPPGGGRAHRPQCSWHVRHSCVRRAPADS